jgi:uncharacterized protein
MRITSFLIFVSIVFLIYFSVNYYIFIRGLQAFAISPLWRKSYITFFLVIVTTFIVGEVLEHTHPSIISEWIYRIGAFWLAFMLYLFIALVLIDIVRLFNHFFHFFPDLSDLMQFKIGLAVLAVVSVVVISGHINAITTRVREISLTIPKKVSGEPKMKIVMVSDVHLGALIGENRELQLVGMIKRQQPDLVLLCGDIVDGDIGEVLRKNLGRHIQEIVAPMGVYAIPGNHEYIGGITKTLPYLESIHIKVLRDESVVLPNGVQIVGRDDRDSRRMGNESRKSLAELTARVDKSYPLFVLNHQPFNLDEAVNAGADLHLSGHTHNGQLWPFNYMTEAIYELSWGYLKKGNTNFYVSSGFGTWGPPVRIGSTPEVVMFNLTFTE